MRALAAWATDRAAQLEPFGDSSLVCLDYAWTSTT